MAERGRSGGAQDGMVSFDVEALSGERWHAESMFDDRNAAEAAAVKLFDSARRPQSVRVVRENFDPVTGKVGTTMVFLRSRAAAEAKKRAASDERTETAMEQARQRRSDSRAKASAHLHPGRPTVRTGPARASMMTRPTLGLWCLSLGIGVVAGGVFALVRLGILFAG